MYYSGNPIEDNAAYNAMEDRYQGGSEVVFDYEGAERLKSECVYNKVDAHWVHVSEIEIYLSNFDQMPSWEFEKIKSEMYNQVKEIIWKNNKMK